MDHAPIIILCAGQGTRMSSSGSWTQKALYPLGQKALVSHILDRFPQASRVVIATGHYAEDVEDFCNLRYGSSRIFQFIKVPQLTGPGSGPGRSALECLSLVDEPFFLVCCDTLWSEELPLYFSHNWIGTGKVASKETYRYCMVQHAQGHVTALVDKPNHPVGLTHAFNGLAFIRDVGEFKDGLQAAVDDGIEVQISHGLNRLIAKKSLRPHPMPTWCDVGTEQNYLKEKHERGCSAGEKESEFFFHEGGLVLKAFKDERRAEQRAKRAQILDEIVPTPVQRRGRFLSYPFKEGVVLSSDLNCVKLNHFLNWCHERLWLPVAASRQHQLVAAQKFYFDETLKRIRKFVGLHPGTVEATDFAGIEQKFRELPWNKIFEIVPVRFHGDLQTENILVTKDSSYVLLDWRENFGGEIEFGDLYYDLAKLHASVSFDFNWLMTHGLDRDNLPRRRNAAELRAVINVFCQQTGLDYNRLLPLESMILVRMSALHHRPLREALWREGTRGLLGHSKEITVA